MTQYLVEIGTFVEAGSPQEAAAQWYDALQRGALDFGGQFHVSTEGSTPEVVTLEVDSPALVEDLLTGITAEVLAGMTTSAVERAARRYADSPTGDRAQRELERRR